MKKFDTETIVAELVEKFTSDLAELAEDYNFRMAVGQTALRDIYWSLEEKLEINLDDMLDDLKAAKRDSYSSLD